jgi:hypothetical protein
VVDAVGAVLHTKTAAEPISERVPYIPPLADVELLQRAVAQARARIRERRNLTARDTR